MKIIDEELLILVQFYLYREFFEWLFVNKLNFLCLIFWFVEKEIIMLLFDCRLCYTNCLAVSCLYRATEDFILILECSNWTSFQCWKWASEFITLLPWVSVVWNLFGWLDFKEKLTPAANYSSSSHSFWIFSWSQNSSYYLVMHIWEIGYMFPNRFECCLGYKLCEVSSTLVLVEYF